MNRFRQWLARHPSLWEIAIDLLAAWFFASGWLIALCGGWSALSAGMAAGRAVAFGLAGVLIAFLLSRKWWICPGLAALGGLALWGLSHTRRWESLAALFQDYVGWWTAGFPQGGDIPYHIQWVQLLLAVGVGAAAVLVMRRVFSFLLLLAVSTGAVVSAALFPAEVFSGFALCLALVLMGLIIVLPRVYSRYLRTRGVQGISTGEGDAANRAALQLLAVPAALVCVGLAFWMVPEDTSDWRSESLVHFIWDMGDLLRLSAGQSEGYWEFQLSGAGYQNSSGRLGGPVELSDDIRHFEIKSEIPVLLRGSVQDFYTGRGWNDSGDNGRFRLESPMWSGRRRDVFGLSLPKGRRAEELYRRLTREVSFVIHPRNYQYCALFTAGRLEDVSFSTGGEDIYFNNQGEVFTRGYISGSYQVSGRELLPRSPEVDQQMLMLERLALENNRAGAKDLEEISRQYLQLPDALPQSVYDTAREITKDCATPYQKAAALCDWLARNCTYTLSPQTPPEERDFVDYFLETREGYCVYYASAMTVMARCAGVPSRFVSGFGMRQGENANWYYTSDATAHAWTEIYLQNIGWIALDPLGWNPSPTDRPDEEDTAPPVYPELPEEDEEEEMDEILPIEPVEKPCKAAVWPFVLAVLLLGISGGIWVIYCAPEWAWTPKRLKNRLPGSGRRAEAIYLDLMRQLALLGYVPETGETDYEFAQRIDERLRVEALEKPMYRAAEAVVGLRFGEIPPEEAQLDGMERYHQELERMVKRKTGRLAYFWRRGIPCVWGAVSGLLTKRSNF